MELRIGMTSDFFSQNGGVGRGSNVRTCGDLERGWFRGFVQNFHENIWETRS
jgi:hypothetical protein